MALPSNARHPLSGTEDSLIGRQQERRDLLALLTTPGPSLITVCGPGGVGKSTLVEQVANDAECHFADGAVFLPLTHVVDATLVLSEIAKALKIESTDYEELLPERWAKMSTLLVLDNLEQIAIECAEDLSFLLQAGGTSRLLVTSQVPVDIREEQLFRLSPLVLPPIDAVTREALESNAAVQLFLRRAAQHDREFLDELRAGDWRDIGELCRLLEGMPLAIELAASHAPMLGPRELLRRLRQDQGSIASSRRDIHPRFRSMTSAVQWSYDLLTPDQQMTMRQISIFPGSFGLDCVEFLFHQRGKDADALPMLRSLYRRSMISRLPSSQRFQVLSTIREYCRGVLGSSGYESEAWSALVAWVDALARQAKEGLRGTDQSDWHRRLREELPTIRAVVEWSLGQGSSTLALTVISGMWEFFNEQGRVEECLQWGEQGLALPLPDDEDLTASTFVAMSLMFERLRDDIRAEDYANRLLEMDVAGDRPRATTLGMICLGRIRRIRNQMAASTEAFATARDVAVAHQFLPEHLEALANLATNAYLAGDFTGSLTLDGLALALARQLGDQHFASRLLGNMGTAHNALGNLDQAESLLSEALVLQRSLGIEFNRMYPLVNLGELALYRQEYDAARTCLHEALEIAERQHVQFAVAIIKANLAIAATEQDALGEAARLVQEALMACGSDAEARFVTELGLTTSQVLRSRKWYDAAANLLTMTFHVRQDLAQPFPTLRTETADLLTDDLRQAIGADRWNMHERETVDADLHALRTAIGNHARNAEAAGKRGTITAPADEGAPRLTPRELEIVQLLVEGVSTRGMADRLCVSPRTVTTHIAHILGKLDASTRVDIVSIALRRGLVQV